MKIGVLDDDKTQLQLVQQALVGGDNTVFEDADCLLFQSGEELLNVIKKEPFDVLILDRKVPDMSGDVILQWIRQYAMERYGVYTIVIMLTNMNLDEDEIYALRVGADEYLTKPVSPTKLILRIQRLLSVREDVAKRTKLDIYQKLEGVSQEPVKKKAESSELSFPDFKFDAFKSEVVLLDGAVVKLTTLEFSLALLLVRNIGVGLSRAEIYERVWFATKKSERSLNTHIHSLRTKLNLTVGNGFVLRNMYGFGYRLDRSMGSFLRQSIENAE